MQWQLVLAAHRQPTGVGLVLVVTVLALLVFSPGSQACWSGHSWQTETLTSISLH